MATKTSRKHVKARPDWRQARRLDTYINSLDSATLGVARTAQGIYDNDGASVLEALDKLQAALDKIRNDIMNVD